MPGAVRMGDMGSGHGCFSPRPNTLGSPNVLTNKIPQHRQTDTWGVHCCGPVCHSSVAAIGSPNVIVNGLPACRIGDAVACGSTMISGSPNVIINQ